MVTAALGTPRNALRRLALPAPLLVFATLAIEVRGRANIAWDAGLMRLVHAASAPVLDRLALLLSALGSSGGLVVLASAVAFALVVGGRRADLLFLAGTLGAVGPVVAGLKHVFERPRPELWQSIAPAHGFSFPSGHAAASFTLAAVVVALTWRTRRRWAALIAAGAFTLGVGLSRVYLGVHFPTDVVAGWCVGGVWTFTVWSLRLHLVPGTPAR